jgi:hypothetical protein
MQRHCEAFAAQLQPKLHKSIAEPNICERPSLKWLKALDECSFVRYWISLSIASPNELAVFIYLKNQSVLIFYRLARKTT